MVKKQSAYYCDHYFNFSTCLKCNQRIIENSFNFSTSFKSNQPIIETIVFDFSTWLKNNQLIIESIFNFSTCLKVLLRVLFFLRILVMVHITDLTL